MDNRARVAIAVLAVAAVVVAFVLASGSDDSDSTKTITATATQTSAAPPGSTATTPAQPVDQVAVIEVKDGKPLDDVQRLSFEKGERVRFDVQSSTADTVHVHGYDIEKPVSAGGTVRFSFPASIEGIFEVELHSDETQIAEIEVNP